MPVPLSVVVKKTFWAKYLRAIMNVRYWEDGLLDGLKDDNDKPQMPLRVGDTWDITIDLDTGIIENWPKGKKASVHYKVCDAGSYHILDQHRSVIKSLHDYVPPMLCPGGNGYGDYVIMEIDGNGKIKDFRADLSMFEDDE